MTSSPSVRPPENEVSCLVIGAGIAGLSAAHALRDAGVGVLVLDKGRGIGGRMATRRFGNGVFDHGAQFMTVRDPRFEQFMRRWEQDNVAKFWSDGFVSAEGKRGAPGHPRYRGHPGMTAVPKSLAEGIDVRLSTRVRSVGAEDGRWAAVTDSGVIFAGDTLIMTPPVPQSLQLLEQGGVELPLDMAARLRSIAYHPCIALLAIMDEPTGIPSPGGMQFEHGNIRWMADNQQKGISPSAVAVTIHASPAFSAENWESEDQVIADRLLSEAAPWLPGAAQDYQVHRWRYSQPVAENHIVEVLVPGPPSLVFAGDAFAGGRVEGAVLSGWRAAEILTSRS